MRSGGSYQSRSIDLTAFMFFDALFADFGRRIVSGVAGSFGFLSRGSDAPGEAAYEAIGPSSTATSLSRWDSTS